MANELIDGGGETVEWAKPLYQGKDASGNTLWSFDKSGNLTVAGTVTSGSVAVGASTAVNYAGDLAVATNKFNVTAASGNTAVAGTLAVTGATTHTGTTTLADDLIGGASADILINTNKFTVAASTGNTVIAGTASVAGTLTAAAINASGTVAAAGAVTVGTTLGVTGIVTLADDLVGGASSDIAINTNKFTVAASSGNTVVAGTLTATGAQTLTGATSCGSTLGVTGTSTLAAVNASGAIVGAGVVSAGTLFKLAGIETGLTAHAGGTQAAALALSATKAVSVCTIVGTDADSVILPAATGSGQIRIVHNADAAQDIQVYAALTETINAVASATGVAVGEGKTAMFVDYASGKWFMLLGA